MDQFSNLIDFPDDDENELDECIHNLHNSEA